MNNQENKYQALASWLSYRLEGWRTHRNINYIHLVNCMVGVRNFCLQNKDKRTEIHAPKFGTSCSGGRWSTISDLIQDCWQGLPVYIYRDT